MSILTKYYRWKAKRSLLKTYRFEIEIDKILEKWITKRILEGQQGRRKELIEKQNRIKETKLFIDFLKKL